MYKLKNNTHNLIIFVVNFFAFLVLKIVSEMLLLHSLENKHLTTRIIEKMKLYKGEEFFTIGSISYIKVQKIITYKREKN